jgi:hypothetical protein
MKLARLETGIQPSGYLDFSSSELQLEKAKTDKPNHTAQKGLFMRWELHFPKTLGVLPSFA